MFSDLNNLTVSGRMGKDPVVKTVGNGNLMASFSVASRHIEVDELYGVREETTWVNVVAWGEEAQLIQSRVRYGDLKKGDHLTCVGRLSIRNVKNEATGQSSYYTQLVLESFQKNDRKNDKRNSGLGNGAETGRHPSQSSGTDRFDNSLNPEYGQAEEGEVEVIRRELTPPIQYGQRRADRKTA